MRQPVAKIPYPTSQPSMLPRPGGALSGGRESNGSSSSHSLRDMLVDIRYDCQDLGPSALCLVGKDRGWNNVSTAFTNAAQPRRAMDGATDGARELRELRDVSFFFLTSACD